MKAKIVYDLVGYDRTTERMVEQHPVPQALVRVVKHIADIGDRSDSELGAWELTEIQVKKIAEVLQANLDLGRCEFFLEPSAADKPRRQVRDHKTAMAK